MANGSLLDYLRKADTKQRLQFKDQIDMMAQCADGMHYLESTVSLKLRKQFTLIRVKITATVNLD